MAELYTRGDGKKALMEDEEFQEEEIWAVMKERESSSLKLKIGKDSSSASPSACHIPALPRVDSGSFESRPVLVHHHQSSAPLNINPDWSKICPSKKSDTNNKYSRDDDHDDFADFAKCDDDEEEDGDEMIPPHEFIARRLARSPIVSFSMCEGIGGTLKGRDLSRLRNAILTKTGFLE